MDAAVKEKWVEALRSGKYEQGQGYLRRADDSMCCLGVLCDLVEPDRWLATFRFSGALSHRRADASSLPTVDFLDMVDLGEENARHLAVMNDLGVTFAEIARYIEKWL